MGDIQEIPLDIPDNAEDILTIPEIVKDTPPPVEEIAVEIPEVEEVKLKPKAKGRPKGSPNKGPPKPRAKKAQIQEAPVEDASEPYEAYEPSSPTRNLRIPTDPSTSDVAAAMLKMLQDQSYSRQTRKQRLYNSWFA